MEKSIALVAREQSPYVSRAGVAANEGENAIYCSS